MSQDKKRFEGWICIGDYQDFDKALFLVQPWDPRSGRLPNNEIDEYPLLKHIDQYLSCQKEVPMKVTYWLYDDKDLSLQQTNVEPVTELTGNISIDWIDHRNGYVSQSFLMGERNLLRELEESAGKYLVLEISA